ncbi:beta-glucosidase [Brevundimonas intermedia]|uniref:beta-glucosidase n=1 Tax=Brevundimonas intermedia TaxID=74315 RepID=UPI00320BAE12
MTQLLARTPRSKSNVARVRADALVAEMSTDEKVAMASSFFPFISPQAKTFEMPMAAGFTPGIPRLGIPAMRITDSGMGVANVLNMRPGDVATAMPSYLATAATFDPSFAVAGGRLIGAEARAKGFNVVLGGACNLTRDPWAGRNFEYLGEDPVLSGRLAGAGVDGVQSNHVACTLKHLALNAQETGRMVLDARIDPVALRESDLLAFEIALDAAKPASVMTAYNRVNGEHAGEHEWLINHVLKGDWDFDGWVMSDWGGVHSTEKAALAGLDQESGLELDLVLNGAVFFTDRLKAAVDEGGVPLARLDDMAARIVTGMIRTGLLDHPVEGAETTIDYDVGAAVAQRTTEAGAVLLTNRDGALPLAKSGRILLVGGDADIGVLSGGGSSQVRSVGGAPLETPAPGADSEWFCRRTLHASSPVTAIRDLAPDATVEFVSGEDLDATLTAAARADAVVVFATQWRTEATDLVSLALPDGQDALIASVAQANPHTVVVLQSGGAVLMPWVAEVGAVLAVWYPGQRGGEAIARLVFGDSNPSGRLPLTFPASDDQAPRPRPVGLDALEKRDRRKADGEERPAIEDFAVDYIEGANVGYRWFEASARTPLFAFGHGLSFTRFDYGDVEISGGGRPAVWMTVTNAGERSGADVPQVYVRAPDAGGIWTWRLAGYKRVELEAGRSVRVKLELEPRAYGRWDEGSGGWVGQAFALDLAIGRSAVDHSVIGQLPA